MRTPYTPHIFMLNKMVHQWIQLFNLLQPAVCTALSLCICVVFIYMCMLIADCRRAPSYSYSYSFCSSHSPALSLEETEDRGVTDEADDGAEEDTDKLFWLPPPRLDRVHLTGRLIRER